MNPKYTDSLWSEWNSTVFKPHRQRIRRMQREHRRQRPVPTWQHVIAYPSPVPPRYPFQTPVQVVTPLSTIEPKVK